MIGKIKGRLFRLIRSSKDDDNNGLVSWAKLFKDVLRGINFSPSVPIGNLQPGRRNYNLRYLLPSHVNLKSGTISGHFDEPRVREAQKKLAASMSPEEASKYFHKSVTFEQQILNTRKFDETKHILDKGSICYSFMPHHHAY
jgi:hypothetical protein